MAQNALQWGLQGGSTSSKPGVWETNSGACCQVSERPCVRLQLFSSQPGQDTHLRVSGLSQPWLFSSHQKSIRVTSSSEMVPNYGEVLMKSNECLSNVLLK